MNKQVKNLLKEIHVTLIGPPSTFHGSSVRLNEILKKEMKVLSKTSKDLKRECIELVPSARGMSQWDLHHNQKFLTGLHCLRSYLAGKPLNQLTEEEFYKWCKSVTGRYWKSYFSSVTAKEKQKIVIEFKDKYRQPEDPDLGFTETKEEIRLMIRDLEQLLKRARTYRL